MSWAEHEKGLIIFGPGFVTVSIAEVERLWVRFQQMGCNDDGDLTEETIKKSSYSGDVFMRNVRKFITKNCPCNIQRFFAAVKVKKFHLKIFDFFLIFAQNIEAILTSTHSLCFGAKIRTCKPSFTM